MKRKGAKWQYKFVMSFQFSAGPFALILHISALVYVAAGVSELYTTERLFVPHIFKSNGPLF